MKQISFGFLENRKKEFGGSLLLGKRKSKRPLSTRHPLHLVLKSVEKGLFSPGNRSLEALIQKTAHEFNIQLYEKALNWSHIHLLIRIRSREDYVKFIRALTSRITERIRKSRPQIETIFALRPFTRILSWGRDFKQALHYLIQNQMEARGLIKRKKNQARSQQSHSDKDKGKSKTSNQSSSSSSQEPRVIQAKR